MKQDFNDRQVHPRTEPEKQFEPKIGDRVLIRRLGKMEFVVAIEEIGILSEGLARDFREMYPNANIKAGDKFYGTTFGGRAHEFPQSQIVGYAPDPAPATSPNTKPPAIK